jgi:hypothetical protein
MQQEAPAGAFRLRHDEVAEHILQQDRFSASTLLSKASRFSGAGLRKFGDVVDEAGICGGSRLLFSSGPAIRQALETPDLPNFNVPHRSS